MMNCRLVMLALIACVAACLPTAVGAQPPDRLESYQFLPTYSTLHQTGGFAGVDWSGHIFGTFDLLEGYESAGPGSPAFESYAAFANVSAFWTFPTAYPGFFLDGTLNLTGLDGEPLPVQAPYDVFRFTGVEHQGAPIQIHAVKLGPWLYIAGANEPEPNTADYFHYEIRSLARRAPFADLNQDDSVDGDDLLIWQSNFGQNALADVDEDGVSTGFDFLMLQRQQGETVPSLAQLDALIVAASKGSTTVVPEPSAIWLVASALTLIASTRRRRQAAA